MNSYTNIDSKILTSGTYECNSIAVKESPQEIICLKDGVITFWPTKGDKFTWNATAGKKIKLIPKKTSVDSGIFLVFYNFYKNMPSSVIDIDYYYLIDENSDNFIDETGTLFEIK